MSLAGLGKVAAGLGVGAAVAKTFTSTISATRDFNQAVADLNAVVDANAGQMRALSDQALRAGQATRFSASEAAQGQIELAKAGLSVEQILGGGLDTALSLAAAGNMEVAAAAETAANAVQLFGLEGADLTGVADALAVAANRTTSEVGDIAQALTQGGAAAKQSGLGFKDTVVALEALALQGVRGSDAGTSLKTSLLALAAPVGEGAKAMKKYGLEFFQANGDVKDFAGIAEELRTKLGGLNRQQRIAVLQAIAGRDGFRTLAAAYDLGTPRIRELRRELEEQGTAAKVAAKRQDSLTGDLEQFTGAVETMQIKVGSAAVPALRGLAQAGTEAVTAITNGEGDVGEFFGGIASAGAGAASVLGDVVAAAFAVTSTLGGAVAPVVAFTGGVLGSEAAVKLLTASVVGLSAAYVASRAAALGLLAVQRAAVIFESVRAFVQLAASVRSVAQAQALLSAATLASPMGAFAAAVGVAAGAVLLLSGHLSSGPSAAEQEADALRLVESAGRDMAAALDAARAAVDKIVDSKLAAASSALAVERAEVAYGDAVDRSGPGSLEARAAANQLAQARRQLAKDTDTARASGEEAARTTVEEIAGLVQKKAAADRDAKAMANLAVGTKAFAGSSKEAADKSAKYAQIAGQSADASKGFGDKIAELQQHARRGARDLAGNLTPAAQAARSELLAIANAKPEDLPKVIAAIQAGGAKSKTAAAKVAADVQAALKNVDTPVSLASFVDSIIAGGGPAITAAQAVAAAVRRALATANADHRNSPSANDLLRTSLDRMAGISETGLKRTQAVTRRGVESILAERVRLEGRLAAIDRAAELRERKKNKTGRRGVIEDRLAILDRAGSSLSDVESGVADIGARIGQALDAALQRAMDRAKKTFDAKLREIDESPEARRIKGLDAEITAGQERRRAADETKRRGELTRAVTDADGKVKRLEAVLARARTDSERAAAQSLLDAARVEASTAAGDLTTFEEDANLQRLQRERDTLAAIVQARRDAAQLSYDEAQGQAERDIKAAKAAADRQLGNLVEKLRAGEITVRQFRDGVARVLGDPLIKESLKASGEELGLAFIRGLARTRTGVESAAKSLAKAVADYLRLRSPARKGPLAFDFTRSGRTLGGDFAAGLASSRRLVSLEAGLVAGAAAGAAAKVPAGGADPSGGPVTNITVNADNPLEDPFLLARRLSYEARFGIAATTGAG